MGWSGLSGGFVHDGLLYGPGERLRGLERAGEVGVALGHAGRGVPEDVLDFAQEQPAAEHLGGGRVAQVVEADVGDAGALSDGAPEAADMRALAAGTRAAEDGAGSVGRVAKVSQKPDG